jgi:hypothetical protein
MRELVYRVQGRVGDALAGVASALYAGDELVAVHLGLRSQHVLCWWLPAQDSQYARCSPASILAWHAVESAVQHGVTRIDLGQGEPRRQLGLANSGFDVAEGVVHGKPWGRVVERSWIQVREWAQSTSWCGGPLRVFRSMRNRWRQGGCAPGV